MEAGIRSETLQRFLARHADITEGRLTDKGERQLRAAFKKTVLVVDEGSLASTVQARELLKIAEVLRVPRVVLVGDAKQLDAVDAGKPFAQLQQAGMKTAVMDQIMRQRDPDLKAAVEASLAGDVTAAFEKLGDNIAEVKPDNLAGAAAARWLKLSAEERERAGLMAPSHALRAEINGIIREQLAREGVVKGPALVNERLVSLGYTRAELSLPENYAAGNVVGFNRIYKRLGVEKGDELRIGGVDYGNGIVNLAGKNGQTRTLGARPPRCEVGRCRGLPVGHDRASRRRPHPLDPERPGAGPRQQPDGGGLGRERRHGDLPVGGRAGARHASGRSAITPYRPRMGIHRPCVPGPDRRHGDRRDGSESSPPDDAEEFLCRDQPGSEQRGTGDGQPGGSVRTTGIGNGRAYRGIGRIGAEAEKSVVEGKSRGRGLEAVRETPAETPDKSREARVEKAPEPKRIEHDLGL